MKKRMLSLFLVMTVVLSGILAGCGKSSATPDSQGDLAGDSKSESSSGESTAQGKRETIKVTFLQNEWHGDPNEMEIFNKLEEIANVDIEWQVYSNATWPDKKNLILASGDLPDVFYMNAVNSNDVAEYSQEGMFIELTDLIDQYCPNLTKAFERIPEYKNICINADDGKIYSIGRAAEREVQYTTGLLYMNKKWLDQLGLAVPATTDEFYTALKAFKENDMNGNGDTTDEIPFSFHYSATNPDVAYSYHQLFGSFGLVDNVGGVGSHFIKTEDGSIVYTAEQEEYKNAISYFSKFVQEGLWDTEGFTTQDTSVLNAKGNNDVEILGSFIAYDSSFVLAEQYREDYVVLEPLAGPEGDKIWLRNGASNGNINGTQFVMTVAAKGKEEAIMRWLDAHFDPEISAQLFLGAIGATLEKTDTGMLDYIDTPEGMSYSEFRYGNAPVHVPCIIAAEDWGKVVQVMDEDINRLSIINEVYKKYETQSSLFLLPNLEESKYCNTKAKEITDYVNKVQVRWLTEGGIEAEWDTYLEQLKSIGIDEYKEVISGIKERMEAASN